jgi:L-seryl-tRNA(Ser) seleniumtransferase
MDVYADLGVTPVINAAGTLTTLGGSLILPEVMEAMADASRSFVPLDELHVAAGARIAEMLSVASAHVEAAHVCAGASAGIVLMAAACMAGCNPERIAQLPDTTGMRDVFVVQHAHRQPFDRALRVAGGRLRQVAPDADALATAARGADVAALFYTFAWFCTGEALPLARVAEIAHEAGVPVIVDAAAEVPPLENYWRLIKQGADLVAWSGGKAIRGPQSSGFVAGQAELVEACRLNDNPYGSVGRSMKVGKEEIAGLVKAVELYVARDHAADGLVWDRRVARVLEALSGVPGLAARRQMPYGIGQQIPHVALTWDPAALGVTYEGLRQALLAGRPRIAVQLVRPTDEEHGDVHSPQIRVHPHTLREGEETIVAERIRALLV